MNCPKDYSNRYTVLGKHSIEPNENGEILWHIVNFTKDMPKHKIILSMKTAMDEWQEAFDKIEPKGRHIIIAPTNNYDEAHIRVVFCKEGEKHQVIECDDGLTREYDLVQAPDGTQKVLAWVEADREYIFCDDGELYGEKPEWVDGIWAIVPKIMFKHEIGHIYDLGHTNDKVDIMGRSYDGKDKPITNDSVRGLQSIWGYKKKMLMLAKMGFDPKDCPIINWEKIKQKLM